MDRRDVDQRADAPSGRGRAARRVELLASAAVVLLVAGYVAVRAAVRWLSPRPGEEQCTALLDRYLEQTARVRRPAAHAGAVASGSRPARVAAARLADVAACQQQLTEAQVRCALRAPHLDALERCLQ